jgi:hypothetical protein
MPEANPQPAGSPGQAQQAPFGQTPAVGATPNRGFEAQGLQRLGVVIKQLEQLIPLVGVSSEIGKDVMKALNSLAKHVPEGAITPAAEKNALDAAQRQNAQNAQMQQMMRAQAGAQAKTPQMPGMAA